MPMAIASFSNLSFAISTVRFLMCGGACSRVMKTEPSLMSSTVASTIWSVSSTGSLRVHIRRSLHQGARTRRGREADAPTVPGRGRGGGVPHTRSLANRHVEAVRLCGVCRRTRCYLGYAKGARRDCRVPGAKLQRTEFFCARNSRALIACLSARLPGVAPCRTLTQVRGRALGATVSDARRPRAGM